jgi:hypothetical protein
MVREKRRLGSKRALILAIVALILLPSLLVIAQGEVHLPVPLFNQAYADAFDYWGSCKIGTNGCPDLIAKTGCLITAFAMVLDYYEVELSIPAASSCTGKARVGMDPGILNDWLKIHGGYGRCGQDPVGNCCLEWTHLPQQISITTYSNQFSSGIDALSLQRIDQALSTGYPIVCGVHWGSYCHGSTTRSEDCHWVVITGKSDDTYTIIDPYNRDSSDPCGIDTTLNRGVFGNYTIDRFVVVSGIVPSSAPRLEISFEPLDKVFHPGDRHIRLLQLSRIDDGESYLLYARVIDPDGEIRYAHYRGDTRSPDAPLSYSATKRSLYTTPRRFESGKLTWNRTRLDNTKPGTWTWEVWLEDPSRPGFPVASDIAAYTIEERSAPVPSGFAVLVAIGLTLIVTAIVYTVILLQEGL